MPNSPYKLPGLNKNQSFTKKMSAGYARQSTKS